MPSIKDASFKMQDELFTNINENITVYFHQSCVSLYTSKTHKTSVKQKLLFVISRASTNKRTDVKTFDFKTNCFYYGQECLEIDPNIQTDGGDILLLEQLKDQRNHPYNKQFKKSVTSGKMMFQKKYGYD